MKTLSLRKDGDFNVQLRVDIFASNADLQEPGFDTKFTNMQITGYDTLASQTLGNIQEIDYSFRSVAAIAENTAGVGLYVADLNEDGGEIELVAQ